MQSPLLSGPGDLAHDPVQELMCFAEETLRMVSVAQTLVSHHRHVDLDGLQQRVGLLCAKALDLPTGESGLIRIELRRLLAGLDALHDTMRENAA